MITGKTPALVARGWSSRMRWLARRANRCAAWPVRWTKLRERGVAGRFALRPRARGRTIALLSHHPGQQLVLLGEGGQLIADAAGRLGLGDGADFSGIMPVVLRTRPR